VNSHNDRFEVVIPSDYEAGQAVVERVLSSLNQSGFAPRDVFGIRLSVDEAVTNAIKHGNKLNPDKTVRVHFQLSDLGVRIEIEDQGPGFCPQDVPDPTADENLERPSGRGLMLMRQFMTRIEYSAKGNVVVLEKLRHP
jgi:serine/threonine-protein kinase RsbW